MMAFVKIFSAYFPHKIWIKQGTTANIPIIIVLLEYQKVLQTLKFFSLVIPEMEITSVRNDKAFIHY